MEKNHTFVKPKNEATVKFYTEVQKIGWVSNPTHFYPRNQLELILPDVRVEHSLVYTPYPSLLLFNALEKSLSTSSAK